MRRGMSLVVLLAATIIENVNGWYVPELSPHNFAKGDEVIVYTNTVNSENTQLPFAYAALNFACPGSQSLSLNLGEILRGDRIHESSIKVKVLESVKCGLACSLTLTEEMVETARKLIIEKYQAEWILDELPSASAGYLESDPDKKFLVRGFDLGRLKSPDTPDSSSVLLYNHFELVVEYNEDKNGAFGDSKKPISIVGFEVRPFSKKLPNNKCTDDVSSINDVFEAVPGAQFIYTYSVKWVNMPEIDGAHRWDRYMASSNETIHWASILNSLGIIIVLTVMVALILVRALHKDISVYNEGDIQEDPDEISGWKMVHGDVFRPPRRSPMLTPILGTGLQLLFSLTAVILMAFLGFLNPSYSGGLISTALFCYMFMGIASGYYSSRFFKYFRGNSWRRNAFFTAITVPGMVFMAIIFANFFLWGEGSSRAIPFSTLLALTAMWFGISLPLVYIGAYLGFRKAPFENPCRTNQIPRLIPQQQWINRSIVSLLAGGALPFAVVFIELSYVLSSVWQKQYYYMYGFLLIVFAMMIVTSMEISIVLVYFQLCAENYRWWWRAFLAPAMSGVYVFGYSVFYYLVHLRYTHVASAVLYFSYSLVIATMFGLVAGTVGFMGSYWFVRRIYNAVKID